MGMWPNILLLKGSGNKRSKPFFTTKVSLNMDPFSWLSQKFQGMVNTRKLWKKRSIFWEKSFVKMGTVFCQITLKMSTGFKAQAAHQMEAFKKFRGDWLWPSLNTSMKCNLIWGSGSGITMGTHAQGAKKEDVLHFFGIKKHQFQRVGHHFYFSPFPSWSDWMPF